MTETVGRRLPDGQFPESEGDYSRVVIDGAARWFNWPPGSPWPGMLKPYERPDLPFHEVEEHEDGTITVRPSILMRGAVIEMQSPCGAIIDFGGWHGWLERGVWRDA